MGKAKRLQSVEFVGTGMSDDCGICGDSLTPVVHAVLHCGDGDGVADCGHKCEECAGAEADGCFVVCDVCLDAAFKNSAKYGAIREALAEERQRTSAAALTAALEDLDAVKAQVHAVRTLYREKLTYGGLKAFFENVERLTADDWPF